MSVEPLQPTEAVPSEPAWPRRLGTLIFVVFCFEIGIFLMVFPWLEPWPNNWMADAWPSLGHVWENPYFRGAVSGVGFVNIYISLAEVFRLRARA